MTSAHAKRELERLPERLRRLDAGAAYPVEVADDLVKLAAEVDRRLQAQTAPPPTLKLAVWSGSMRIRLAVGTIRPFTCYKFT